MSSRNQDREDRMLAYYINLIQQQEKAEQDAKASKPGTKKPEDEKDSMSERKPKKAASKPDEPMEESKRTKRSLSEDDMKSIPAKSSKASVQEGDDNTTPRKAVGAKALAQQEADRIISTILERRPGRAEFSVPTPDDSRKRRPSQPTSPIEQRSEKAKRPSPTVTDSPIKREPVADSAPSSLDNIPIDGSESTVDNRIKKKKSLAEIEAERIIATIKPKDETKQVPVLTEAPISPVIAPVVPEPKPPRAKKPAARPATTEKPVDEPVAPAKPAKQPVERKQPTAPAKVVEKQPIKRTESADSVSSETTTTTTFKFHHRPQAAGEQWWRKKVSLYPIDYEEELQAGLKRIEADYQSLDESELRVSFIA